MNPDVIALAIPARTEYLILARLALAGIAHEVPIEQSTLADLKLAVTEACGNAIRHANPAREGVVRIRYAVEDDMIEICVEDDGPGIPEPVPRSLPPVELTEGGMGLAIIDALVDDLEIGSAAEGRGTTVRMRRRLSGARTRPEQSSPRTSGAPDPA